MLVAKKQSKDGDVVQIPMLSGTLSRLKRAVKRRLLSAEHSAYANTRLKTLEIFSDDRVPGPERISAIVADADVINLHWVAGFMDHRGLFASLPKQKPLVWTLHDMNPFTGGCHYALGCQRFTDACGACVQLRSTSVTDVSQRIFKRKFDAFSRRERNTTKIVTPSRWLAEEARRSVIFRGYDIKVMPYGLDCEIFRPRERKAARDICGLPQDTPIVMFAADGLGNHRKGFDLLLGALDRLPRDLEVALVAVGNGDLASLNDRRIISLGPIADTRFLSAVYSASDLFVLPTRADNLPNVILEAMACGLPLVAFDVGGVPDMVRPEETGLLASAENINELSAAIYRLIKDAPLRFRMGKRCREVALAEYSLDIQATQYRALYEQLTESSHALRYPADA